MSLNLKTNPIFYIFACILLPQIVSTPSDFENSSKEKYANPNTIITCF